MHSQHTVKPNYLLCLALSLSVFSHPAFAKDDSQTAESSTNVLQWPTMNYTNFLAGHPNEARRARHAKRKAVVNQKKPKLLLSLAVVLSGVS